MQLQWHNATAYEWGGWEFSTTSEGNNNITSGELSFLTTNEGL